MSQEDSKPCESALPSKNGMKYVVAVDGSHSSHRAFEIATSILNDQDQLYIYHAEFMKTSYSSQGIVSKVRDTVAEGYSKYLNDFYMEKCRKYNIKCEFVNHNIIGGPAVASKDMCEFAGKTNADLVFVGTRKLSPTSRLLLGSFSSWCLNYCEHPVTIVKSVSNDGPNAIQPVNEDVPYMIPF